MTSAKRSALMPGQPMALGQQRQEGGSRGLVPDAAHRGGVGDGPGPELQLPPAIAGRITIVSLAATAVSSPSSTLTSSSFRYTLT